MPEQIHGLSANRRGPNNKNLRILISHKQQNSKKVFIYITYRLEKNIYFSYYKNIRLFKNSTANYYNNKVSTFYTKSTFNLKF